MWLATVAGPSRRSAGATGSKVRGNDTRPETIIRGSLMGLFFGKIGQKRGLSSGRRHGLSNMQGNPCKSAFFGVHAAGCGDYVMRS